jgi:hypothetical protein
MVAGDRLQARQIDNQFKGLMLKSAVLNQMTHQECPMASRLLDNKPLKGQSQYSYNMASLISKQQCGWGY